MKISLFVHIWQDFSYNFDMVRKSVVLRRECDMFNMFIKQSGIISVGVSVLGESRTLYPGEGTSPDACS